MFAVVPKGFIPDIDNDTLKHQYSRGAGHLVSRDGHPRAARGRSRHPTPSIEAMT